MVNQSFSRPELIKSDRTMTSIGNGVNNQNRDCSEYKKDINCSKYNQFRDTNSTVNLSKSKRYSSFGKYKKNESFWKSEYFRIIWTNGSDGAI